jgi:allophanate hydrolase
VALATDTAGSGRVPAACCGIVGFKPTRQRVSTEGVVPASASFDAVSVFSTAVADAARVFDIIDEGGGCERSFATPPRIAVPTQLSWFGDDDARACYDAAVERAGARLDAAIVELDFGVFMEASTLLYDSALVCERFAAFGEFVEQYPADVDPAVRDIVLGARHHDGVAVARAFDHLRELRRAARSVWDGIDVLLLPTIARHPTVDEALAHSLVVSRELGTYTNFVNPFDLCAIAVPSGTRRNGLPFGVSFIGPAFTDRALLELGASFLGEPSLPRPSECLLAVAGAHLRGQPLNHQLIDAGGWLVAATTTSASYRLYDLGLAPPKPGLVRTAAGGVPIEVEVWSLDAAAFGRFVSGVPAPLGIGSIELADGTWVNGFICEPVALDGAVDITEHRGWRAYLAATGR